MKLTETLFAFILTIALAVPGCQLFESGEPETAEVVPYEVLRHYPGKPRASPQEDVTLCGLNISNIDMDHNKEALSGPELVITDEEAKQTYITCEQTEVDMDTHIVLSGRTTTQPHEVCVNEQDVQLYRDTLYYQVEIGAFFTTKPGWADYIVKIDNAYLDYPVQFYVDWREED